MERGMASRYSRGCGDISGWQSLPNEANEEWDGRAVVSASEPSPVSPTLYRLKQGNRLTSLHQLSEHPR